MTAPFMQIMWSHRLLFLGVMCLTFLALAVAIFTIPKRVQVRSSIEIGSAVIYEKPEALEPPEQIARQISSVYGPATLLTMAGKGTSPSILGALQNPSVESIGHFLVVISTVHSDVENEAREFQENIVDQVIKELAPRARALRESIAARITLATRASDNLEQQMKAAANEIERVSAFSDNLRGQLEDQRANLAALYQRTGTALQPADSTMLEAHIRELVEQISSQLALMGNLTLEHSGLIRDLATTRRQYEAQTKALVEAQFEQNNFKEPQVSLPPTLMPATTPPRPLSLLLVAFVISVLVAFGTVVLVHNVARERFER